MTSMTYLEIVLYSVNFALGTFPNVSQGLCCVHAFYFNRF